MTKSNQIIHVRDNICEIMIIKENNGKQIVIQDHQIRKR
jgi:hypothetical protein